MLYQVAGYAAVASLLAPVFLAVMRMAGLL